MDAVSTIIMNVHLSVLLLLRLGGMEYDGNRFRIEGWALLFHPDLLYGSPSAKSIKGYSFFSYQVNEALHMNSHELDTLWNLLAGGVL